jgi:hypothetical protein
MICIYTDKYTNRLKYVTDHIFKRILGQPVNIINKVEDLPTLTTSPLIVYSDTVKVKGALHILPNGLLFKKGVREYDITMSTWDGEKVFFTTEAGDIPFDIFDTLEVSYKCDCSRKRMEKKIKSLGKKEIISMLDEQEAEGKPRELTAICHFCSSHYTFTEEQLTK